MPHRPPPDRTDDIGFTTAETGELIGRTAERVRQLCVAAPGFGVRAADGTWRVPQINALAAYAIQLQLKGRRGRQGLSAAEFARRTMDGTRSLLAIGQIVRDSPDLQAQLFAALETKLAGWWQERHGGDSPPELAEAPATDTAPDPAEARDGR